jgi:hypothetical protein
MKCYVAHKIDDDTVYYKCSCGETHTKDNDFDFYSNRSIFRSSECSSGDVVIHITEDTQRVLPPKLLNIYTNKNNKETLNILSKRMRKAKLKYGRRYLGKLGI